MKFQHLLPAFLIASVLAPRASATLLAYEGFASDATGSGGNYQQNTNLEGVSRSRTGFTGAWTETDGTLTSTYNVESVSGNLTYANYQTGDAGRASAFLSSGTSSAFGGLGRTFDVADAAVSDGYFLSVLIDFNNSEGGFTLQSGQGSDNRLWVNGTNLNFDAGGGSSTGDFADIPIATAGVSASGTNLFILEYTDETPTSGPSALFYTRWNLYINPDLSGGSLLASDIDYTGFGIGLLNSGSAVAPASFSVDNRYINPGANMYADEVYLASDSSVFVIPEPSSLFLTVLAAVAGALLLRRRR